MPVRAVSSHSWNGIYHRQGHDGVGLGSVTAEFSDKMVMAETAKEIQAESRAAALQETINNISLKKHPLFLVDMPSSTIPAKRCELVVQTKYVRSVPAFP